MKSEGFARFVRRMEISLPLGELVPRFSLGHIFRGDIFDCRASADCQRIGLRHDVVGEAFCGNARRPGDTLPGSGIIPGVRCGVIALSPSNKTLNVFYDSPGQLGPFIILCSEAAMTDRLLWGSSPAYHTRTGLCTFRRRAWRRQFNSLCRGQKVAGVAIEEAGAWSKRPGHVVSIATPAMSNCEAAYRCLLLRGQICDSLSFFSNIAATNRRTLAMFHQKPTVATAPLASPLRNG
jgi:hypothetical protein